MLKKLHNFIIIISVEYFLNTMVLRMMLQQLMKLAYFKERSDCSSAESLPDLDKPSHQLGTRALPCEMSSALGRSNGKEPDKIIRLG